MAPTPGSPAPGWYPDPAGRPGTLRWWDGSAWTGATTASTHDPADGRPESRQPGSDGTQAWQSRQGRRPAVAWLLGAALLLALGLVIWLVVRPGQSSNGSVRPDTNSAKPTVSAWDEQSRSPSAGSSVVRCPRGPVNPGEAISGDRLRGGGVSVERIAGWADQPLVMPWVSQQQAQVDEVYPGWISTSGVGGLAVADGFREPKSAAHMMLDCFATSDYYRNFTGRSVVVDEAMTIDGHQAWWLREEVHVAMPDMPQVAGDVVDVVVVDTGASDFLGVYFNSATIGDTARQRLVDRARESLRVG